MNGHRHPALEAKLQLIEPSEVAQEWPFLQEQLTKDPELWDTFHTLESIRAGLEHNVLQLWVAKAGEKRLFWGLSDVWTRQDGKQILVVWWAQGVRLVANMPMVLQLLEMVAKSKGFAAVTVRGRRGWERVLKPFGFNFMRVEVTRNLET